MDVHAVQACLLFGTACSTRNSKTTKATTRYGALSCGGRDSDTFQAVENARRQALIDHCSRLIGNATTGVVS
jgi:hypothetical protein